ncbi:UNVERIFIED_ORG: hypothetical protein DFO49_5014 [Herbaspirillum seropedicae]
MRKSVPQAERSKQEATENIERKLNILLSWATNGIPFLVDEIGGRIDAKDNKILDFYPTSLRSFKEWDGSQNCAAVRATLPEIARVGNDTLAKRPELEQKAIDTITALKHRSEEQSAACRPAELKRLEALVKSQAALLKIRQSEFRTQRVEFLKVERDLRTSRQDHENDKNYLNKTIAQKDVEIAQLSTQVAELIQQLRILTPLKKVDDHGKQ